MCDEQGLTDLGIPREQATELVGWGQATDGLSIASRGEDLLRPVAAGKAYQGAMKMAGAAPNEVSFAEVNDCFSVMVPLAAEIAGLTDAGTGLSWWLEGNGERDGLCPLNTSGGLIAKGHPISATGVAMIGWTHQQLTHQVPAKLQVKDATLGTTLNIGGPICSTVVTAQRPAW